MILDSSFEVDSSFSLDEWEDTGTSEPRFSSDVPPGGGLFSVTWLHGWTFGRLEKVVPVQEGTHMYLLSCWAKAPPLCPEPSCRNTGWIEFELERGNIGTSELLLFALVKDSTWTEYSLTIAIDSAGSDSLRVILTCPYSQDLFGYVFFDLVTIEQLTPG
jgi:hypothetical protein